MKNRTVFVLFTLVLTLGWAVEASASHLERLGTEGDDSMHGARYGTAINALGGDDLILGFKGELNHSDSGKDIAFGGEGNDVIKTFDNSEGNTDDLFGGGFCRETGYYGFEVTAGEENWPDPDTLDCNIDGADLLKAGAGDDWLWESNSDVTGDGQVDTLNGGPGSDICVAEDIDIVKNCEEVHIIT